MGGNLRKRQPESICDRSLLLQGVVGFQGVKGVKGLKGDSLVVDINGEFMFPADERKCHTFLLYPGVTLTACSL